MENLNDVEFGSDKSAEEAPILIAQRYLNIYRQIHIFNKAKRDQFDDELLALPPQVTNFFKRMPGGRLLVEHIEDVKTERGIAFVKSNKDDFAEGSGFGESSPQPMPTGAIAPIVGGSVTVDASFAEALANSMASAFKNTPMQATVSGEGTVSSSIDFGNTFDVIAEEIRTSRASLLDILKETKSITDSVIASQVSISRILEGILSSRTKDNIGTADLNNRIIASQTSITKLLEGLYSANIQKNNEISDYLNIETKLQAFKNEMRAEIEQSLNKIQNMFSDYSKTLMSIQSKPVNLVIEQDYIGKEDTIDDDNCTEEDNSSNVDTNEVSSVVISKKKKKKKKNKNKNSQSITDEQGLNARFPAVVTPTVNGVIRNEEFKHNDSFDNVNLNELPLDFNEKIKHNNDVLIDEFDNDFEDDFDDGLDFVLPEQGSSLDNKNDYVEQAEKTLETDEASLDNFTFNANEETSFEETTDELGADEVSLDDFTFNANEETSFEEANDELGVDEVSLDDFTFDANEEISFDEAADELGNDEVSLDDFTFNANEETSFDEANNELGTDEVSLDDFTFDANKETSFDEANDELGADEISLDDFTFDANKETSFDEANNELGADEVSLDDFTFDANKETSFDEATDELGTDEVSLDDFTFNANEETSFEEANNELGTDEVSLDDFTFDANEETSFDEANNELGADEVSLDDFTFDANEETSFEEANDELGTDEVSLDEYKDNDSNNIEATHNTQSRYSAELDKIRAALTSDNIDLSSLDEPISLDEYNDDENVPSDETDDDWEWEYVEDTSDDTNEEASIDAFSMDENISTPTSNEEEWEYEYVDENGNPIENNAEGDWEWEYVEEDNSDNKE